MRGLTFEQAAEIAPAAPNRADIACFVGLVARRVERRADGSSRVVSSIVPAAGASAASSPLYRWLSEQGWVRARERIYAGASTGIEDAALSPTAPPWARTDEQIEALLDVPVPVTSFESFARLFAWELRPYGVDAQGGLVVGPTYLGAAVRSFFAQGGRRCYVVRVGDPFRYDAPIDERREALPRLLGFDRSRLRDPRDRATFRGVGHLHGLPDVSFVCLPDLADACAKAPTLARGSEPPVPLEEPTFAACSVPLSGDPRGSETRALTEPRVDEAGYLAWAGAVRSVALTLRDTLREVQLVAAIPLPVPELGRAGDDTLRNLRELELVSSAERAEGGAGSLSSAFVQLVWPWVQTRLSGALPGRLESPDALLVGVLARNALLRGSHRSAARLPLGDVVDFQPRLRREELENVESGHALVRHVSLLGRTARGPELLSDVTTSGEETYRQAAVQRLMSAIVRAARVLGEQCTFEASGPRLWVRLQRSVESLLTALWREGALEGESPRAAFQVRCDRSTMRASDLDQGRVCVEIELQPSALLERIRVVLMLSSGSAVLGRMG